LVYQEQVMEIANKLAGYSMSRADNLRMAMGKKKKTLMDKEHVMFVEGCFKNGYKRQLAEDIFQFIAKFAAYGFNKPHSASYALIAYWTAYMKANYPVEFMTALLSAELQGIAGPQREIKMSQAIEECRRMEIKVLEPDINLSFSDFSIDQNRIRFGMSAIKHVGASAIDAILDSRKTAPFSGFKDFLFRVDLRRVNKKTVESLIKAGAFHQFGNRATLLSVYPVIVREASDFRLREEKGQFDLFHEHEEHAKHKDSFSRLSELSEDDVLMMEKEVIGFHISKNPLARFQVIIQKKVTKKIGEILADDSGNMHIIAGIVGSKRILKTRKNEEMVVCSLFDETGSIEVVAFPKTFEQFRSILMLNKALLIKGEVNERDGRLNVILRAGVDLQTIKTS